jgi:hypothetical protein
MRGANVHAPRRFAIVSARERAGSVPEARACPAPTPSSLRCGGGHCGGRQPPPAREATFGRGGPTQGGGDGRRPKEARNGRQRRSEEAEEERQSHRAEASARHERDAQPHAATRDDVDHDGDGPSRLRALGGEGRPRPRRGGHGADDRPGDRRSAPEGRALAGAQGRARPARRGGPPDRDGARPGLESRRLRSRAPGRPGPAARRRVSTGEGQP